MEAWHGVEAGGAVPASHAITFENWDAFLATFSSSRLDLLRHLARTGPASLETLAARLGRSEPGLTNDVAVLDAAGLVKRDGPMVALVATRFDAHLDLMQQPAA